MATRQPSELSGCSMVTLTRSTYSSPRAFRLSSKNSLTRPQWWALQINTDQWTVTARQTLHLRKFRRDEQLLPRDARFANFLSQSFLCAYTQHLFISGSAVDPQYAR
jgi:hypothetical protein